jgi:hypothetical protein
MLPTHRGKRSARAAWEAVKSILVGVERVRESKAQQLRREFAALTWKEGESAEDFSMRITSLANNLRMLSNDVSDTVIVCKMLDIGPEHLEQVVVAIETLLDLNTRDGSFARGRGYPRIPDPMGAGTDRKIHLQARVRASQSTRGQLTGINSHSRVHPLPASK